MYFPVACCHHVAAARPRLPPSPRQVLGRRIGAAWGFPPMPAPQLTPRELVDRLDARHEELVSRLDELNAQIEAALAEFGRHREAAKAQGTSAKAA